MYYRMDALERKDYDVLKTTLLKRYGHTETGFRSKFRNAKPEDKESFGQYVTRLCGYFDRWIDLGNIQKTFEEIRNMIIKEQVLNMCGKDLKLYIEERIPQSLIDMTRVAEQYLEVHGKLYGNWGVKLSSDRPLVKEKGTS